MGVCLFEIFKQAKFYINMGVCLRFLSKILHLHQHGCLKFLCYDHLHLSVSVELT